MLGLLGDGNWTPLNVEKPQQMGSQSVSQWKKEREQGVGFLVQKEIVKSVIGCRPVSSRLFFLTNVFIALKGSHF